MGETNTEYGADQIQILEGLEAVRKRPGMYIGSTSSRGLHHLVYEIVDNAVDEALAGYCTEINVAINPDNSITVVDNGRGIPVGINHKAGIPAVEVVFTILHAGGKFGGGGYKVSGGLHGVGASVVNALSEWLEVSICRDGKRYEQRYERGKTMYPLKEVGECGDSTGTTVTFLPDKQIFEETVYDYDILKQRLREMAFLTKGLKIILTDKREGMEREKTFHYEGGIKEFVSYLNKGKPPLYLLVLYYGLILWICIWFYRLKERRTEKEQRKTKSRERWVGVPGILLVCLSVLLPGSCWLMHQVQGQVTVTVLDVGQGDGICIRMPGGKNCLIDGGSSDVSSVGAYRIEPYLLYCGIRNIDYAFVSHGDEDHISGIRELLQDQKLGIGIRTLVLPAEKYWDEKLKELAVLAAENGTRIAEIHAGEQVVDGTGEQKMSLRCIGPEMVLSESGNAASMVLQAEYGNFSMLLTGDVEGAGEKQLVKSGRLGKCRILKAAHHGSKNSGTEEFLDAVEPQIVLISAGRGNRYGHPHEETLERLKSRNCQVYSTQQCGAVTIQSDGKKLFFSRKCGGGGSD